MTLFTEKYKAYPAFWKVLKTELQHYNENDNDTDDDYDYGDDNDNDNDDNVDESYLFKLPLGTESRGDSIYKIVYCKVKTFTIPVLIKYIC